jgi:hypothetical protein
VVAQQQPGGAVSRGNWRAKAAPIIADILAATAGQPESVVRAALRRAYPFGARQYWPYKVWCDEIRVQRGLKKRHDVRSAAKAQSENPNQGRLLP